MNDIWKYNNYQYNGVASLKPQKGEVAIFLTQDQEGRVDFVSLLNANIDVTSKVWVQIIGAEPVDILLKDDPTEDIWLWNSAVNSGNFTWKTKPGYTDGVVIGHINFVDNYCVRSSYTQLNTAITKMSVFSGTVANVTRMLTQPYTAGQVFEFCQYPVTAQTSVDATCPGAKDGSASIGIIYGPSNVQYRWYNSAGQQIGTNPTISGLGAGTYYIFVNDTTSEGCTADRQVTIIDHALNAPSVATTKFTCAEKGSASASPNGGKDQFVFTWFNAGGTQIGTGTKITNLNVGSYYVRVTDSCGSVATTWFDITSIGCCGDAVCGANEVCGAAGFCAQDCGVCCPAGTRKSGSSCVVCEPGTRSTTLNAASCTACPANTYNAGGAEACTACPPNFASDAGSGKCVRCPVGQVRGSGESACHTCSAGSFAAPCDDSSCTPCPAGTYTSASGAHICSTCPAGTFAPSGATSCAVCDAGTYSAAGSSSCTQCPTGTSVAGATHMLACA